MTVLDRVAIVLAVVLAPAALALSCAPDLRVVTGTGGAPGTGGASTGGGLGTGGTTASTGGSDGGTGGAFDAGGDASDAASDAADDGGDGGDGGASDAADDGSTDGSADGSTDGGSDGGDDGSTDAGDAGSADAADSGCANADVDPHNCGRCGHDCCGGACVGGLCQPFIISEASNPGILAVDQNFVYWPDGQGTASGTIMRAPKAGGPGVALTPVQNNPYAVAVDSTSVYWVNYSNTAPSYGGVFKAPVGGGTVVPLLPTGEVWANDILVNGTNVFWDDYASNEIRSAGLDGSGPTTLAGAAVGVGTPQQMAIDGQFIYWSNRFNGATIQKAPLAGGGLVNLSTGQDPVAVAVDSVNVYWANYSSGNIQKAPLAGGTASLVATSGGNGAWSIATDGVNVYWGNKGAATDGGASGSITAAPANGRGGLGTVLATSPNPLYITIDASCVYWADNKNGNIGVVGKP